MIRRRALTAVGAAAGIGAIVLGAVTAASLHPPPERLAAAVGPGERPRVLAADGAVLSRTFANRANVHDAVALHEVPPRLRDAFRFAEDRRFFEHDGVDWRARAHAAWQSLLAGRIVRGASTITEQAVRIAHPRPRTLWSRWLESFEARRLEARFAKPAIFEFYLNQVPYASNRRGVVQAARHYFDRSLDTLSTKEMLALAVLVRAPSRFDLHRAPDAAEWRIRRLAERMRDAGVIDDAALAHVRATPLATRRPSLDLEAPHFVRRVRNETAPAGQADAPWQRAGEIVTTLSSDVQRVAQRALDARLRTLAPRRVRNGAALVVDHERAEILAWAIGGAGDASTPARDIDAALTPRQPGSTLKPFVYALALETGWTAATVIDDAPLDQSVGLGLHRYHNYSRSYYGPVTVRAALGNSLNVPAVKALQRAGTDALLARLHRLGVRNLADHPDVYGDGLALGNGEVTLLELVQAYATLARGGRHRPLRTTARGEEGGRGERVFSDAIATLVADILSDPHARALEFGTGGVLRFPVQTAIKTGTSNDHRDTWAVAFNHRFTVGVWMGNLDRRPTDGLTGASGPAGVVRDVFAHLNRRTPPRRLRLSPALVAREVCIRTATGGCTRRTEWFLPGTGADDLPRPRPPVRIRQPHDGLRLASDPRIPDAQERFRFALGNAPALERVEWYVDDSLAATTTTGDWLWPVSRGEHRVRAQVFAADIGGVRTREVTFEVR